MTTSPHRAMPVAVPLVPQPSGAQADSAHTPVARPFVFVTVGSAFTYVQSHLVTSADTCNPSSTNPDAAGPCVTKTQYGTTVNGIPNPDHRDGSVLPHVLTA